MALVRALASICTLSLLLGHSWLQASSAWIDPKTSVHHMLLTVMLEIVGEGQFSPNQPPLVVLSEKMTMFFGREVLSQNDDGCKLKMNSRLGSQHL